MMVVVGLLRCVCVCVGVPCSEGDYKSWSPSDELGNGCLLGREMVFKRRTPHATCFNGEDFDRPVTLSNCSCTRQDYEWYAWLSSCWLFIWLLATSLSMLFIEMSTSSYCEQ